MDSASTTGGPLRFGAFELDVRLRELRKGATRVRLQEQPFEVLRLMLERPGDVVTREQLRQRLWPDGTFVDFEHSLNAAVKRLRAALGDDAEHPRFVETLPRRGYRFIAPLDRVEERRPAPHAGALPRVKLAVLPFANLSGDPAQEYFSDGLTEELISQRVSGLPEGALLLEQGICRRHRRGDRVLRPRHRRGAGVCGCVGGAGAGAPGVSRVLPRRPAPGARARPRRGGFAVPGAVRQDAG